MSEQKTAHDLVQHYTSTVYVVASITGEKRVLLVFHKKLLTWLPPGGHADSKGDFHELPHVTALREVLEETGLTVHLEGEKELANSIEAVKNDSHSTLIPTPHHLQLEYISPSHNHIDCIYFASAAKDSKISISSESSEAKWFSQKQIGELEARGEVWPNVAHFSRVALQEIEC
jgi:8-oxo-dGTP pyrophosphatase MutT (NUDIX family)